MKPSTDKAQASPTKQFFVSMLTRDISLDDAILDLLDNCLDGAMRIADGDKVDYAQHFVTIRLAKGEFVIEDNCGGIPRDVAVNYAFKMGREPDDDRDSDTETIGMYGVGMKRAIFKMGRNALVRTRHGDDTFEVPITSEWLEAKNWDPLPIMEPTQASEKLPQPGTTIIVTDLYEGVARHFDNEAFENKVRTAISEHFTMFLQWGLTVMLNGNPVEPVLVEVLVSEREDGPAPYVFRKSIDGVLVSISVGRNTNRALGNEEEDDAGFERDRSSATAGWTVLCNDRAVIVGDKSRLTGWGGRHSSLPPPVRHHHRHHRVPLEARGQASGDDDETRPRYLVKRLARVAGEDEGGHASLDRLHEQMEEPGERGTAAGAPLGGRPSDAP
jgi:hypothetical protein